MDTVQGVLGIIISMSTVLGVFTGIINKLFSHKLKPIENKIDVNSVILVEKSYTLSNFSYQYNGKNVDTQTNTHKKDACHSA